MKTVAKAMGARLIMKHEGLRLKPYICPAGKLTVGYGRNIEDLGITEKEAEYLLTGDILRCKHELLENVKNFSGLHPVVQAVLLDMIFALGLNKFLKFKKMLKALNENNITKFIKEMLDSNFARSQPNRINDLVEMIKELESLRG